MGNCQKMLDSTLDLENMLYDETSTFGFSSDLYDYQLWLNDVNPNALYNESSFDNHSGASSAFTFKLFKISVNGVESSNLI